MYPTVVRSLCGCADEDMMSIGGHHMETISKAKLVLFPICGTSDHWTLLAVRKVEKESEAGWIHRYYETLPAQSQMNRKSAQKLLSFYYPGTVLDENAFNASRQYNDYDCGCYVFHYAVMESLHLAGEPLLVRWPHIKPIRSQLDTWMAMFKRFQEKDEKIAKMKESSKQYVKDGKASGKASSSSSSAAPKGKEAISKK